MKAKCDYKEVYAYAKQGVSVKDLQEMFGISRATVTNIISVGNGLMLDDKKPSISKFTPRELMTELASRGYTGTLTYTQKIDISNF